MTTRTNGPRWSSTRDWVATQCRERGVEVLVHPVDVSDATEVAGLARAAVAQFGAIDVWVNCAAVLMFASFEAGPDEAFRRVMETNFFGYVNGARAALAQFRQQRDRGVLINVSSVLGVLGEPTVSAYVASKFAIRGWSACLRQELIDSPGIHVCTVLPAPFDTPIYQKAANYVGRRARSIFPVADPAQVARAILRLARHPWREVVVGWFGRLLSIGQRVSPSFVERIIARVGPRLQYVGDEPTESTEGNLLSPLGPHERLGGWREYWRRTLRHPML
jgi:NAD(P)-dependent dehydrogenase (short-subunit alcohol dehydrogenase family)